MRLPTPRTTPEGEVLLAAHPTFDDWYAMLYPSMVRLAFLLSGSFHVAEEIAQEAFLAAYRDWNKVSDYEQPDAWVRRVVVNKANSRLRRVYAEGRARFRWAGGRRVDFELPETATAFWKEVRDLPKRQAQSLVLYYSEGYSTTEIAGTLGCAEATVRVHLHRGRLTLAERMGMESS